MKGISRRVGVHTSISGGIHLSVKRAHKLGCTTMQIFSHNPRSWRKRYPNAEEIELFRNLIQENNITPVFVHASYLINLSSAEKELWRKSIDMLLYETELADILGIDSVIFHPGRASGQSRQYAIKRTREALRQLCKEIRKNILIIENTAGQRGEIGSTIEEIAEIVSSLPSRCIKGICIDTAHAFASGYDLSTYEGIQLLIEEIKRLLSPLPLLVLHLNDSKASLGGRIDRHEHIGKGYIGREGFRKILSHPELSEIPLILETPKTSDEDDIKNLALVREIIKTI
jgi:deoxyribonuclease-4